jgi:hypothetical protein
MSSVFGHDPAAVYRDRVYALRPRASWLAIGAAFAVGVGAAVAVMKMPASLSDEPAKATASQDASKPATPPAQGVAGRAETAAKAPVRVIAPDAVPPPPNVTALATREAPRAQPKPAVAGSPAAADPNVGMAPRDQAVDPTQADAVPMPPPRPAELRIATAHESTPDGATVQPAEVASPASTTSAVAPPAAAAALPQAQEPTAKPTRKEARPARREARRAEREDRRRLAQERTRYEAEGDRYRAYDGRGYMVPRRYDDDRGRAMAYGGYDYRPGARGFFGLFDFD